MSRFPKGLLLLAVLAELMVLTVASRTEILSFTPEQPVQINRMSVLPALPDASRAKMVVIPPKAKKQTAGEVITVEFKTAPRPVI